VFTTGNSGLPGDDVLALATAPDGAVWVGTRGGGLAHFRPLISKPVVTLIGVDSRSTFRDSSLILAARFFDPSLRTEPQESRFHWALYSKGLLRQRVLLDRTSSSPFQTVTFSEEGTYTISVSAIDKFGYRSDPSKSTFAVEFPVSDDPISKWLKRIAGSGVVMAILYLIVLPSLLLLYPAQNWARTAVNSGYFSRFPLVHKTILNTHWARRLLFLPLVRRYRDQKMPDHYIPQSAFLAHSSETNPPRISATPASLQDLFRSDQLKAQDRERALILGRSGTGKSVLLRYLACGTSKQFLEGKTDFLPVLIDLGSHPPGDKDFSRLILNELRGADVELPDDTLLFFLEKGGFLVLIDSLNEVHNETALAQMLHTFLNRDARNRIILASQTDPLERNDILLYKLSEVTGEQAKEHLVAVDALSSKDQWDDLPAEAKEMASNPQDLDLLSTILQHTKPELAPTHRADLYRDILKKDSALKDWFSKGSEEIRAIYALAYRMLNETQQLLQRDNLARWLSVDDNDLPTESIEDIVTAVERSRMFKAEVSYSEAGLEQKVIGFRHELMGKYLAARHLSSQITLFERDSKHWEEIIELAGTTRMSDVFFFAVDDLDARSTLNHFLTRLLEAHPPNGAPRSQGASPGQEQRLKIVAYALSKKEGMIDENVRGAYTRVKISTDVRDTPASQPV